MFNDVKVSSYFKMSNIQMRISTILLLSIKSKERTVTIIGHSYSKRSFLYHRLLLLLSLPSRIKSRVLRWQTQLVADLDR
jgi:hypothetical protein